MEDTCFICANTLATVEFISCGHRFCCRGCHEEIERRSDNRLTCSMCRTPVSGTRDATAVQLQPATPQLEYQFPRETYPFGALLLGNQRIADAQIMQVIEEAVAATRAGSLPYHVFRNALGDRLTASQREMALVYLFRNVDYADVVSKLELLQNSKIPSLLSRMTNAIFHGTNGQAIFIRAALQTAFTVGVTAIDGIESLATLTAGDCATSFLLLAVFSAVEYHRYQTGLISKADFHKNIGEHVIGTLASLGASYLLAISTATLTGPLGLFLAAVMSGLLADATGRSLYRLFFPSDKEIQRRFVESLDAAHAAARNLKINLNEHTFAEAQGRSRRLLLSLLPENHLNASPERLAELGEQSRIAITSWAIVREHYLLTAPTEDIAAVEEGFLITNVLKMYDAVAKQWKIVRTWFGELQYEPREGERVDTLMFYF